MKRNILLTLSFLLAITLFCGCNDNRIQEDSDGKLCIRLSISTTENALQLKGEVAGVDELNENKLNSFYYYFFRNGITDEPALIKGFANGLKVDAAYEQIIPVNADDFDNLVDEDLRCNLFIVANPTTNDEMKSVIEGNPTLEALRAATVISNMNNSLQDNFVMVFDDIITVSSRMDQNVNVEAELRRLACKFEINANVQETIEVEDDGVTRQWKASQANGSLYVSFGNAIKTTTLGGFDKTQDWDEYYYESTPVELKYTAETTIDAEKYYSYKASAPIYTYPMEWNFTDQFEPYLMFDVVWKYKEDKSSSEPAVDLHNYYKLMLGQKSITSNDWYVMTVQLGTTGNLLPRDPLVEFRNMQYLVQDWSDAFTAEDPNTPANIKNARYLMVPVKTWEVNNETSCEIPFSSSHECEIVSGSLHVTKKVFYDEDYRDPGDGVFKPNKPHDVEVAPANIGLTLEIDNAESKIEFKHQLVNSLGASMDYSPYVITFKMRHKDDPSFVEGITITQYPAIWIDCQLNSSGEDDADAKKGYVYVNKQYTNTNNWQRVLGAASGQSGNNTSRYMAVIHASQFESYTGYIIGDPRKTSIDNLNTGNPANYFSACAQSYSKYAKAKDNSDAATYRLSYYYPTNDELRNYVAPVIRVTSAHAHMSSTCSYQQAKQRCATYQEDGYPAGRWRLPTEAEMDFINTLSTQGFIPSIFAGSNYWYAGGWHEGSSNADIFHYGETGSNYSTRCVYDEWYWSKVDEQFGWTNSWSASNWPDNTTNTVSGKGYVWGDVPRDYVAPVPVP